MTEGNLCVEMPGVSSEINIRDCDQREKLQRALKVLDEEMVKSITFLNTLALNPRVPRTEYI